MLQYEGRPLKRLFSNDDLYYLWGQSSASISFDGKDPWDGRWGYWRRIYFRKRKQGYRHGRDGPKNFCIDEKIDS